ncbi:MAG: GNAT family N-acetyltransferase [Patescibacteria group bacterium]
MKEALSPYYGGDHGAHAERIFSTHISGGVDQIGHFSFEQKMFIGEINETPVGMIHVVGKRQGTYKISPLIVSPEYRNRGGIGSRLLKSAEEYAQQRGARQMYCTVALSNEQALGFFIRKGYVRAGSSDSHYKAGVREVMLYKLFVDPSQEERLDAPNISVVPMSERHESQARELILSTLPDVFRGVDDVWVTALFEGYKRSSCRDINTKYKLVWVAVDRNDNVLGVTGATPKKGEPIKVMPLVASSQNAFIALLRDIPHTLAQFGHKLYVHIVPTVEETIVLQRLGWDLDAAMPAAYHPKAVTQQWSFSTGGNLMRNLRVKQHFLAEIAEGKKTLEVRVGYDNIKTIRTGERVLLASNSSQLVVRIRGVRQYPTFDAMLNVEEAAKIVPGKNDLQVLWLLREIYGEDRERLGVYVLDIEVEQR